MRCLNIGFTVTVPQCLGLKGTFNDLIRINGQTFEHCLHISRRIVYLVKDNIRQNECNNAPSSHVKLRFTPKLRPLA